MNPEDLNFVSNLNGVSYEVVTSVFKLFSSLSYATSLYSIELGAHGWNRVNQTCVEMQELDGGRRWLMI